VLINFNSVSYMKGVSPKYNSALFKKSCEGDYSDVLLNFNSVSYMKGVSPTYYSVLFKESY
jgi:hypothetical protein